MRGGNDEETLSEHGEAPQIECGGAPQPLTDSPKK